eukprot:jgi/Ulvmu1/6914/UM031_0121.1
MSSKTPDGVDDVSEVDDVIAEAADESAVEHASASAPLLPDSSQAAPNNGHSDAADEQKFVCSCEIDDSLLQGWPPAPLMIQELKEQYRMGGPLSLNLFFIYARQIVTMAFLGHHGETRLAAASLAMVLVNTCGSLLMMGLCGATDTLASQAYGAGQFGQLSIIFQRTCLFLAAHALPISTFVLLSPPLFRAMGQPAAVADLMGPYIAATVPGIWLDVVDRPMNRILTAQQITRPQMWISGVVLLLHCATNYLFFNVLGLGYVWQGVAATLSRFDYFILQVGYIWWAGLGDRVWGTPSWKALAQWRRFASLAYPAALMRCMESFCYSGMTVIAGLLPAGATAVSAIGVAFNIYGVLFMAFLGQAVSVGTRVGNALGAGRPGSARLSSFSAVAVTPLVWVPIALALTLPFTQGPLVALFTKPEDERLRFVLGRLLYIVAALELLDGLQTVMSGVVTGAGKQLHGAAVNFVAYYVVAVPVATCVAFLSPLWVYGLYLGLSLGPLVQSLLYGALILTVDWPREAHHAYVAAHADS